MDLPSIGQVKKGKTKKVKGNNNNKKSINVHGVLFSPRTFLLRAVYYPVQNWIHAPEPLHRCYPRTSAFFEWTQCFPYFMSLVFLLFLLHSVSF